MASFNSPDYKVLRYLLNNESGRYEKQPTRIPFNKLPFELKIEPTQDPKIQAQGAEMVITGRFVKKKREFFSGLRKTIRPNWFYGNDYEFVQGRKLNSLVVFAFSGNNAELMVYYFNRYYIQSAIEREAFIKSFISHV